MYIRSIHEMQKNQLNKMDMCIRVLNNSVMDIW